MIADFDFETYSEAGSLYDHVADKWDALNSSGPGGLPALGAWKYSEHASTEVLCLAYDLKDGLPARLVLNLELNRPGDEGYRTVALSTADYSDFGARWKSADSIQPGH